MNNKLIANLKLLRKKNHLNQSELATKLNVSRQAISNWETGRNTPDIDTIIKLAHLYHIPLDQLVSHKNHSAPIVGKPKKTILGILFAVLIVERSTQNAPLAARIWIDYLLLVLIILYFVLLLIDKKIVNPRIGLAIYNFGLFLFGVAGIGSSFVNLFSMRFGLQITCFACGVIAIGYIAIPGIKHLIGKVKSATSLRV
ncbi:MAG: helix-turn-helix domain-containing protein [Lentilactobacillus buchneri]|jgi:transcriptional regulator with XRE-family HTH domain|nr:helix-turn-helix domain-containing protein [Lentilactobacillus buchneri]MCI2019010.1 helix-turn-helix domain-containing protein [Lentilactobacillus buchneri]